MKKLIALLLLAIVMAFSFGIVACGGEPQSEVEKPEPEEQFNPEEKLLPLAKAVIGKVDDVFTQDAFKYTFNREDLSSTFVVEKDEGGFVAYQSGVNVYDSSAHEDVSDMYAELSGKTFSEDVSIMLEKFNPFYLFNKNDKYYMWTKIGNGELSKAQYDEILSGVTLTDPAFAGLFDPDNFKINNIGDREVIMGLADGKTVTIGDNTATSVSYCFNLGEPNFDLTFEVNEKLYHFVIDYVSSIQEFANLYTTEYFSQDFKNNSADFTINYENLTELHESKRDADAEISATLPLDLYLALAKLPNSSFRLKYTTTTESYQNSPMETSVSTIIVKDGKMSNVSESLEYYYDIENKNIVRKVANKFISYEASAEQKREISKSVPVINEKFFNNMTNSIRKTDAGYEQYWSDYFFDADSNQIYLFGNPANTSGKYAQITYADGKITFKFEVKQSSSSNSNVYIYEFDQIGTAELTIPTATGITPADFLSQMEAQGAYTMGTASGNNNLYKTIEIDHGQGYIGEDQSIYNKDGKYYVVERYGMMSGDIRYYEIDEDTYDKLLPTNNYWYADFFDADNYTVSGSTVTFNSDKYQGTVEFSGLDMIISLTDVNALGFVNDKVALSLESYKVRWSGEMNPDRFISPVTADTFFEVSETTNNQFSASYDDGELNVYYEYKDNFVYDSNYDRYFVEENGADYVIERTYTISNMEWAKSRTNERVDLSEKFELVGQMLNNGEFEYVALNTFVGHDDEGNEILLDVYISRYNGQIVYYFTFNFSADEYITIHFYEISKTVPTEKVVILKTLDEIKTELGANNFVLTYGGMSVDFDGKSFSQQLNYTEMKGYSYCIYDTANESYTAYFKTLNANGVFEISASQNPTVQEVTVIKDAINCGLVSTSSQYPNSWYEWKNDNVQGVDGVNKVKLVVNVDGSYVLTTNDTEVYTLTNVGQVSVGVPSNDAMTLFVESLLFHKDFTWKTEGYFSEMCASYPGVEALAGAKFFDFTMKSDNDTKFKYSSNMYYSALDAIAPPGSGSTPDEYTEMYAKREEVGGTLYAKPQGASQWTTSTATQEQFDVLFAQGISEKDLLTLFDASKYTNNGDGTYTLNGTVQWRGTGDEPVDLTNVTVTVTDSTMVLSGSAQIAGMLVDLDYTFYNLNSTSVTLPNA